MLERIIDCRIGSGLVRGCKCIYTQNRDNFHFRINTRTTSFLIFIISYIRIGKPFINLYRKVVWNSNLKFTYRNFKKSRGRTRIKNHLIRYEQIFGGMAHDYWDFQFREGALIIPKYWNCELIIDQFSLLIRLYFDHCRDFPVKDHSWIIGIHIRPRSPAIILTTRPYKKKKYHHPKTMCYIISNFHNSYFLKFYSTHNS